MGAGASAQHAAVETLKNELSGLEQKLAGVQVRAWPDCAGRA